MGADLRTPVVDLELALHRAALVAESEGAGVLAPATVAELARRALRGLDLGRATAESFLPHALDLILEGLEIALEASRLLEEAQRLDRHELVGGGRGVALLEGRETLVPQGPGLLHLPADARRELRIEPRDPRVLLGGPAPARLLAGHRHTLDQGIGHVPRPDRLQDRVAELQLAVPERLLRLAERVDDGGLLGQVGLLGGGHALASLREVAEHLEPGLVREPAVPVACDVDLPLIGELHVPGLGVAGEVLEDDRVRDLGAVHRRPRLPDLAHRLRHAPRGRRARPRRRAGAPPPTRTRRAGSPLPGPAAGRAPSPPRGVRSRR